MTKSKEQILKNKFKEHLKKSGFKDPDKTYDEMMINGDHLNSLDPEGFPLSHVACLYGMKDIVPQIIQKGLVNTLDKKANTPLHWACYFHHHNLIELLVNNGADVDKINVKGVKPLLRLLAINNDEMDFASMKLILDKSKDPIGSAKEALNACGIDNVTPNKPTAEMKFLRDYIHSKVTNTPGSFTHTVSNEKKVQELEK